LHRIIIGSYGTSYRYPWCSKWRCSEILPLCPFFCLFFYPFSWYPAVAMASTISSSSSLTPADSVSIVSGSAPSSTDVEIKHLDGKIFVRVHLERLKRHRRGWWWNFGAEWEETSSADAKFHWVCAVCVRWKAFLRMNAYSVGPRTC
jgi:hypothetical protein